MKKLMFMFGVFALAVSAQAASVKWTCTNVYAPNATDKMDGIAYFVNAATLSQGSLASLKSASDFTQALDGMYSWTPTTAGNYGSTASNTALGYSEDGGQEVSAYLLIFDTATITDDSKYFTTDAKTFTTFTGTQTASVSFMSQATASRAAGAWSSVVPTGGGENVPEPTSGLLMLLGMAGLALRRKCA